MYRRREFSRFRFELISLKTRLEPFIAATITICQKYRTHSKRTGVKLWPNKIHLRKYYSCRGCRLGMARLLSRAIVFIFHGPDALIASKFTQRNGVFVSIIDLRIGFMECKSPQTVQPHLPQRKKLMYFLSMIPFYLIFFPILYNYHTPMCYGILLLIFPVIIFAIGMFAFSAMQTVL